MSGPSIELLESLLDSGPEDTPSYAGNSNMPTTDMDAFFNTPLSQEDLIPVVQLQDGEIDPRLLRTSYSSNLSMHSCPRRHQLKCLGAERSKDANSEITFAFGHVVGEGIQNIITGMEWEQVLFRAYLGWHAPFDAANQKQKKSLNEAIHCLQQFRSLYCSGFLNEYEVAYFEGKPAAELSFRIHFPYTKFRGFVDLVLRHKLTGELLVLELKTTSAKYVRASSYKNSAQAIGYSVVLDKIQPGCSSYGVLYLVYLTQTCVFEHFEFPKTYHQRALWLRDRILDEEFLVKLAQEEGSYGIWPMYGEACYSFGRDCDYMDICQLPTERIMVKLREHHYLDRNYETGEEMTYQFDILLEDLLLAQEQAAEEAGEDITWSMEDESL